MGRTAIHKFSVKAVDSDTEPTVRQLRRSLRLADLRCWQDYYIEFESDLTEQQVLAVMDALSDGVGTIVTHNEPLDPKAMAQVVHHRGVVDNESGSIVEMCELLGLRARAGKVGITFQSCATNLVDVVRANFYNPATDELHVHEPHYETLVPAGYYRPAERYDLRQLASQELADLGKANGRNLTLHQMSQIRSIQQSAGDREVTDVLLEALDARWSDHCSHTTWRSHGDLLTRLVAASESTRNPNIVSMFDDNAGVWKFYDGYGLAIKAETHNGPSAVSAYFGQLTKIGGVLRDILGTGLGADPIGCFEYTATGPPEDPPAISSRPAPRQIALETIRAVKEYGNTFGVPMMSAHMTFHPRYRAKPFALGGSVGLIPLSMAHRGVPQPGDLVVLIGGLTGNEGIHGASASSAGATMDQASVQIGAPLEQVKFRKAIIDLRDRGCIRALTDLGGAGLNSAAGEMGEACGIWLNTALVPLKTSALPMWRILLSESQERMLLAVPPDMLGDARQILQRHQVRATVIGRFTDTQRYCVFHNPRLEEHAIVAMAPDDLPDDFGELGFDLPYKLLEDDPGQIRVGSPPPSSYRPIPWPSVEPDAIVGLLEQVVSDPEVASQRYATSQYDSTVQGNTLQGNCYGTHAPVASSYWAGTPVAGSPAAVVLSTAFNPWLYEAHPVRAVRQMFCALLGGQILAGVDLIDICLCDNFYTPQLAEHAGAWLVAMVDELACLVRTFGVPIISGKDSSAGSVLTDEGIVSVPPAVFLTALGKIRDGKDLLRQEWAQPGNLLVRIGPAFPSVTATVASRVLGVRGGMIDDIEPADFGRYLAALAHARHLFHSGTPIGSGGIAARLVTGALASGLGLELADGFEDAAALFAEHRCGALVEVDDDSVEALPAELRPVVVGRIRERRGVWLNRRDLFTADVAQRWAKSFEESLS